MKLKRVILAVAASSGLFACGASEPVKLSVRAGAPKQQGLTQQQLTLGNGISIDRVRMVVRSVKFDLTEEDDTASTSDDSHEVRSSPFLIDLSGAELDGGVADAITADVPAGTYEEAEIVIQRLEDAQASLPGFEELVAADASIIIEGTIDGAAFRFVSRDGMEQELPGSLVIGDVQNNVTLNVDPRGWFGGSDAARLDPRTAENQQAIENNIEASLEAFEDDDSDGAEDAPDGD